MKNYSRSLKTLFFLSLSLLLLLVFYSGCTKKLDGEQLGNLKPIVWFVNIPPEGYQTSVNPIVNWVGQDRDGQIVYYRYIVVREDSMGYALGRPADWHPVQADSTTWLLDSEIQQYVNECLADPLLPNAVHDTLWSYLYVDINAGDPKTSNIIPMSAEISNPFVEPVAQFLFVQAFDDQGLGSDITSNTYLSFRRFFRIDNPPETQITGFVPGVPFINAIGAGGVNTGIRLHWEGSDIHDYPTDPPPFEFEWKLLGPYTPEEYSELIDSFMIPVFVTNDAQTFRFGQPPDSTIDSIVGVDTFWTVLPTAYITCNTTYEDGEPITICDTILIDTLLDETEYGVYGTVDTIVRILDDDFQNSAVYNRIAESSMEYDVNGLPTGNVWVTDTRDSIYNVYSLYPSDTSIEMRFVFWVRCRDDAHVPDLTPDFINFTVINPKFERDVLVIDVGQVYSVNRVRFNRAEEYWMGAVNAWIDTRPDSDSLEFDTDKDYIFHGEFEQGDSTFLRFLLTHKIVFLVNDNASTGVIGLPGHEKAVAVYTAIQAGVNAWIMARATIGNIQEGAPGFPSRPASPNYEYYWGTRAYSFCGFGYYLNSVPGDTVRVDDFIGALSLDDSKWPHLHVDTATLHQDYKWVGRLQWLPERGAQPGVGWAARVQETEVLYLYESFYGPNHPVSSIRFHGAPVAHRLNRGLFRTVHFVFSPMAMENTAGYQVVNNVLEWLWTERWLGNLGSRGLSDMDSETRATAIECESRYWDAYWGANGDKESFYQIMNN
ncbi:MAG: hypothetical protein DRP45_00305 [Candidatus Zixiibacteriota bacterium]|nr:MAG: hypothetical protein DRP45_00305 [candidate division Zixibacteria bacterium]